eukprot:jgi/Bigna1/132477/aug1.17_g7185
MDISRIRIHLDEECSLPGVSSFQGEAALLARKGSLSRRQSDETIRKGLKRGGNSGAAASNSAEKERSRRRLQSSCCSFEGSRNRSMVAPQLRSIPRQKQPPTQTQVHPQKPDCLLVAALMAASCFVTITLCRPNCANRASTGENPKAPVRWPSLLGSGELPVWEKVDSGTLALVRQYRRLEDDREHALKNRDMLRASQLERKAAALRAKLPTSLTQKHDSQQPGGKRRSLVEIAEEAGKDGFQRRDEDVDALLGRRRELYRPRIATLPPSVSTSDDCETGNGPGEGGASEGEVGQLLGQILHVNANTAVLKREALERFFSRLNATWHLEDPGEWAERVCTAMGDGATLAVEDLSMVLHSQMHKPVFTFPFDQRGSDNQLLPALRRLAQEEKIAAALLQEKDARKSNDTNDDNDVSTAKTNRKTIKSQADARGKQALPLGWKSAFDSRYRRQYYYNPYTGERTWKRPKFDHEREGNKEENQSKKRTGRGRDDIRVEGKKDEEAHTDLEGAGESLPQKVQTNKDGAVKKCRSTNNSESDTKTTTITPDGSRCLEDGTDLADDTSNSFQEKERPRRERAASAPVASSHKSSTPRAVAQAQPPFALPPGWRCALDTRRNRTYYYHRASGNRTWVRPVLLHV